MDAGAKVRRGDIFWIAPLASGETAPGPAHPHVVVQDDVFNASRVTTVIVCALTTNPKRAKEPGNVLLDAGEGGLETQSVVVVSQVDAVEKTRLGVRVGALSERRIVQILEGMRFLQASYFDRE